MEIIVEGVGCEYFTPNEIILNFNFVTKGKSYEEVLEKGCSNVELFIDGILLQSRFSKNDFKTRSFVIKEETKYNNETREYDFDGFSFNQFALLKFDYDKEKLSKLMENIATLTNPPTYQISFDLKNEDEAKKEVLKYAYQDAFKQAKIIADAAGKDLKRCIKVDFKPINVSYISESNLGYSLTSDAKTIRSVSEAISNTFTPEDIKITETLYCLWIAE